MASAWFYTRNGKRFGPCNSRELRELARTGELSQEDLIWKEGMKEWRRAGNAPGLFPAVKSIPDSSPPTPAAPAFVPLLPQVPTIQIRTSTLPHSGETHSKVNVKAIAAGLLFALVIAAGVYSEKQSTDVGDGNGTRHLFGSSELESIAADRRLTAVYSCGDLTPKKLRVYKDVCREAGGGNSAGVANSQMLLLTKSANWFRVAKAVGLSKEEFRQATNFVFAIGTNGTFDPTSENQHRALLKTMTGKTLKDY